MGQEIATRNRTASLASPPKLGPLAERVISQTSSIPFFPPEDSGKQIEFQRAWNLPERITQPMIDEARDALVKFEIYMQPHDARGIGSWLLKLGELTASAKMPVSDIQSKLVAYVGGLRYPRFCFTARTLYAAARYFTWFPSFAELCAWLDKRSEDERTTFARLQILAGALPREREPIEQVKRYADLTPEEREAHEVAMAEMRRNLASMGVGNTDEAAAARRADHDTEARRKRMDARMKDIVEAKRKEFMEREEP